MNPALPSSGVKPRHATTEQGGTREPNQAALLKKTATTRLSRSSNASSMTHDRVLER